MTALTNNGIFGVFVVHFLVKFDQISALLSKSNFPLPGVLLCNMTPKTCLVSIVITWVLSHIVSVRVSQESVSPRDQVCSSALLSQ